VPWHGVVFDCLSRRCKVEGLRSSLVSGSPTSPWAGG
jgi:hypothetical protein